MPVVNEGTASSGSRATARSLKYQHLPPPPDRKAVRLPSRLHASLATDPDAVYVVRRRDVVYLPATIRNALRAGLGVGHLVPLCPTFTRTGDCPNGSHCDGAHAHLGGEGRLTRHVAPPGGVWPSVEAVPYPRVTNDDDDPTSVLVVVGDADTVGYARRVPCSRLLVTGATPSTRAVGDKPLTLCAHWAREGACNYGAECRYAHPISVASGAVCTAERGTRSTPDTVPSAAAQRVSPFVKDGGSPTRDSGDCSDREFCEASYRSATSEEASPKPRTYPFVHRPYSATPL
uniref:C3H1-type domain-containing protein n=1 Tax=Neobodo designis TaxID=312471 RepID=A0A7S1L600_NEODS|mmetsp:Transcript_15118/g.46870  ORF Transcript_15118/g.46870 Transcript_15118/m.46870 type:complete len:289 (+) Transcript_15118:227-1093(+)